MTVVRLRPMERSDWPAVGELIHLSTNYWYQTNGKGAIFRGPAQDAEIFCETYEILDPDCGLVAEHAESGRLMGSCFYHPRPTHVSLGIMNAHPAYFGLGVARALLNEILRIADAQGKPVRLVSSALNLDSFSLYNRTGFVPRLTFQDMLVTVPPDGMTAPAPPFSDRIRPATFADLSAIETLEAELVGIRRPQDYRFFVEDVQEMWSLLVSETAGGVIDGFLASVAHPASNMIGPGVARTDEAALALLYAQLQANRGRTPVFLLPVTRTPLVQTAYSWGARNCELHFAQVRGTWHEPTGIVFPTFLPESG